MTVWLAANWGTILISLILVGVVSLIVVNLRNRKKQGISSCGCNCTHCAMGGACHRNLSKADT